MYILSILALFMLESEFVFVEPSGLDWNSHKLLFMYAMNNLEGCHFILLHFTDCCVAFHDGITGWAKMMKIDKQKISGGFIACSSCHISN